MAWPPWAFYSKERIEDYLGKASPGGRVGSYTEKGKDQQKVRMGV